MGEQGDELDTGSGIIFAAAKRLIPRHNEDLQNRILIDAVRA